MSEETDSQRDLLSPAELRSAIEALSRFDLVRLKKKADRLTQATGMEPDDLLHEAVVRTLKTNGGRNCPCNVEPVIFLGNVMRSIASHERTNRSREMPTGDNNDDKYDPILNAPDPMPSPEEIATKRFDSEEMLTRCKAIFDDDPQAQAIVIGIMEGWSPHEIREIEPMSENEYAAARKRMQRKLLRELSRGPTHE